MWNFDPARAIPVGIAAGWLVATLLAGGFYGSTQALLSAAAASALLLVAATMGLRKPSFAVLVLAGLAGWTLASQSMQSRDGIGAATLPLLYALALWLAEQADGLAVLACLRVAILVAAALALDQCA